MKRNIKEASVLGFLSSLPLQVIFIHSDIYLYANKYII